jgi:glucokinase
MSERFTIGIDIGGTNVRVGMVTSSGQCLYSKEIPILAAQGPAKGIQRITNLIEEVIAHTKLQPSAIGIGATGLIDLDRGAIINPWTLPTWDDVVIVKPLQDHFGIPVWLENDADAAAMGENWVGAGEGYRHVTMFTFGTGVGTANVINGQVYRGHLNTHTEGGHLPLDPNGPECFCGGNGCWEVLCAGPGIAAITKARVVNTHSMLLTMVSSVDDITSEMVVEAARKGDEFSQTILKETARYIGLGIVSYMWILLPDCVVLGGGIIRSYDLLQDEVERVIKQHSKVYPIHQLPIRVAKLGQLAGVIGGARCAINQFYKEE